MSSNTQQLSACCVSGSIHDGTPTGTVEEIGGCQTYVAKSSDNSKAKIVIFIADIFGYELPNVRILADEYAKNGFHVVIPDLFEGDYVPHTLLKSIIPQQSDPEPSLVEAGIEKAKVAASLGPWVAKHREAVSKPILVKFVEAIKAQSGVGKIASVGFCWGGRYTLLLCSDAEGYPSLDAGVANHPSFVSVPDEFKAVNKPVLVQIGDKDAMLSVDQIQQARDAFKDKPDAEVSLFPGAVHGFTVRGDQNVALEKQQKENATEAAIKFLQKHLS